MNLNPDIKRKHIKWMVIVGLIILGYFAFDYNYPSGSWRYKLTVTVKTPDGDVSGYSVREVKNSTPITNWPGAVGNPASIKGEAVSIDMGDGNIIFGLIDFDSDREVYHAFPLIGPTTVKGIKYYRSLPDGKQAKLTNKRHWPQFVTFTDMQAPKTVTRVTDENIEDLFGQGVSIKSVTVEITNEPVTRGKVDDFLDEEFWKRYRTWNKSMTLRERSGTFNPGLSNFKKGKN